MRRDSNDGAPKHAVDTPDPQPVPQPNIHRTRGGVQRGDAVHPRVGVGTLLEQEHRHVGPAAHNGER